MDGNCKNCGKAIQWWGKERLYCRGACRQQMCRERKDQRERAQREQERMQVQADWKRLQFPPNVVEILDEILLLEENEHSLRVVQLVTKAIETYSQFLQKMNEKSR
jgi:hypothetical protein